MQSVKTYECAICHGINSSAKLHYIIRHTVRVSGTSRTFRSFVRSEYAPNTAAHADTFDTLESAEDMADSIAERYRAAGHKVTKTDILSV